MKKIITLIVILLAVSACSKQSIPKPEISEGLRGTFGIDKNINEETIDKYLNLDNVVYRDMRMLKDPGNYEAIGGDSYLSGFIEGFEVIPFPLIVNVDNLPDEVGKTHEGDTLFTLNEEGNYIQNYEESLKYLEYYFPKDKYIFLMCGGGGYAAEMKNLLTSLGWNEDKIYNVGAYWSYEGKHKIEIKEELNGDVHYNFWKVPYHDINFNYFNKVS